MIQNRNPYLNQPGVRPGAIPTPVRHPNIPFRAQPQGFPIMRNTNNTIPLIQNQPNFVPPIIQANEVTLPTAIIPTQLGPIISNQLDANKAMITQQHPFPSGVVQVSSQIFSPIAEGVPLNVIQSGGETMLTSVVTRPLITSRVREGLNYPTSIIHKIDGQTDSLIFPNNSTIYEQIQSINPSQISHFPVGANGMLGTIVGKKLLMSQHKTIAPPSNFQIADMDPITPGIQTSPGLVVQTGPSRIIGNVSSTNDCCPWWCWLLFSILFLSGLSVGGYYLYKKYFKHSKKHRSHRISKIVQIDKSQHSPKIRSSPSIIKKQQSKTISKSSSIDPVSSNKTTIIKQFTDPVDQIDNPSIKTTSTKISKLSQSTNAASITKSSTTKVLSKHHLHYYNHHQ